MRKISWAVHIVVAGMAVMTFAAAFAVDDGLRAEEISGKITVQGAERSYFAVRPAGADKRPLPTVVILHGALMDGRWMRKSFGMDAVGREQDVLAVYPDGLKRVWSDGRKERRPFWRGPGEGADDVAFLGQLARRLVDDGLADPRRLYLVGVSNGGMMAFRMACEAAGTFTAYAAVIASMPVDVAVDCRPGRPVPMLIVNATNDPIIPWSGGTLGPRGRWGAVISTVESVDFWRRNNGCDATGQRKPLPDINRQDGTTVLAEQYGACKNGAPVVLVTIEGGGHIPPGADIGNRPFVGAILGKESRDISAADLAWKFFRRFPAER